jgi:hypothetical protein
MDQQEVEMLRQRVAFLEEMVERCLEQIRAVESRLALVEGQRMAPPLSEETVAELAREVSDISRPGEPPRGGSRRVVE